jgi:oxygen-independent coproporphyrinogen III oxidase
VKSLAQAQPSADNAAQVFEGACDNRRPLGLYVHFPFCGSRCPYCDFAIDVRPDIPHEPYATAVCDEVIARSASFVAATPLVSVYFGGGTPGLWRSDCIARVLETASKQFAVAALSDLEITVEANPGEITESHLRTLKAAGVNRVSFGIQSFDAALLLEIGRTHTVAQALQAIPMARAAGFTNVACDLMFGLPGQSLSQWRDSISTVIEASPDHLSCYSLTIEPFTPFGQREKKGQLNRPDDDAAAEMWDLAHESLSEAGYEHYEVSSYARKGFRAVHNTLYWTQGAYLGVGCAAASFRPLATGGGWRFINPRSADTYMQAVLRGRGAVAAAQVERRSAHELAQEAIWLALRTIDGIDRQRHLELFGADPLSRTATATTASELQSAGWLEVSDTHIRPTPRGLAFADEMATRLWD